MADDDKTTIVESGEEAPEETKAASSGGKKKLFMLAGVGVGAIVVGVVLTVFVLKPMLSSDSTSDDAQIEETQDKHGEKKEAKKKTAHKKRKAKKGHGAEATSYLYSITDIVVNPAGSGGGRFLSVSFAFELESSYMAAVFEEREPIIRDALITILSSKTVAQLTDPKQKEVVRYLIKKRISRLMDTEDLAGVYYTDFVLQ